VPGVPAVAPVLFGPLLLHPGTVVSMGTGGPSIDEMPSSGGALLHPGGGAAACVVTSSVMV
jgi:hypothetical protein